MRKGKMVAQGCHSVLGVFFEHFSYSIDNNYYTDNDVILKWFYDLQKKICVSVDSEEELLKIYSQCIEHDLNVYLVQDQGLTEFKQPTYTCLAIGPDYSDKIDKITGNLPLL